MVRNSYSLPANQAQNTIEDDTEEKMEGIYWFLAGVLFIYINLIYVVLKGIHGKLNAISWALYNPDDNPASSNYLKSIIENTGVIRKLIDREIKRAIRKEDRQWEKERGGS